MFVPNPSLFSACLHPATIPLKSVFYVAHFLTTGRLSVDPTSPFLTPRFARPRFESRVCTGVKLDPPARCHFFYPLCLDLPIVERFPEDSLRGFFSFPGCSPAQIPSSPPPPHGPSFAIFPLPHLDVLLRSLLATCFVRTNLWAFSGFVLPMGAPFRWFFLD